MVTPTTHPLPYARLPVILLHRFHDGLPALPEVTLVEHEGHNPALPPRVLIQNPIPRHRKRNKIPLQIVPQLLRVHPLESRGMTVRNTQTDCDDREHFLEGSKRRLGLL